MTAPEIQRDWKEFYDPMDGWISWADTFYKKNFHGYKIVIDINYKVKPRTYSYTVKQKGRNVKVGKKVYSVLGLALLMAFYWIEGERMGAQNPEQVNAQSQDVLNSWTKGMADHFKADHAKYQDQLAGFAAKKKEKRDE